MSFTLAWEVEVPVRITKSVRLSDLRTLAVSPAGRFETTTLPETTKSSPLIPAKVSPLKLLHVMEMVLAIVPSLTDDSVNTALL